MSECLTLLFYIHGFSMLPKKKRNLRMKRQKKLELIIMVHYFVAYDPPKRRAAYLMPYFFAAKIACAISVKPSPPRFLLT